MQRGEIYFLDLKYAHGSVQAGIRPVIIIQNNKGNEASPTTIVCPITSQKKTVIPTHVNLNEVGGLRKGSIALCEQLITVNKSDLLTKIGAITTTYTLQRLNRALMISTGLIEEYNNESRNPSGICNGLQNTQRSRNGNNKSVYYNKTKRFTYNA